MNAELIDALERDAAVCETFGELGIASRIRLAARRLRAAERVAIALETYGTHKTTCGIHAKTLTIENCDCGWYVTIRTAVFAWTAANAEESK